MNRPFENSRGIPHFHNFPGIHDSHPLAHHADHAQVVGDKDIGQIESRFEVKKKFKDRGLHRNVQPRRGLVQNHKGWIKAKYPCKAKPSLLAAAEFVGIEALMFFSESYGLQHFPGTLLDGLPLQRGVDAEGLREDSPDFPMGIQG